MLKIFSKKICFLSLTLLTLLIASSCGNEKEKEEVIPDSETANENIPEYYENNHGNINSGDIQPKQYLNLYTNLKVKTEIETEKNIEVTFTTGFDSFSVDDPALEGLETKKILELYSDWDQKLNFSITRIIYSGEKSFYYTLNHLGNNVDTMLSRKEVYSKDDTLSYFVNDFSKNIPTNFSINYDDFREFSGNVFCVVYLLTITPCEGNEIRLFRPASSREVNLYHKEMAQDEGINVGDLVNYVHFTKVLEKELLKFNYVNLKVEEGMIKPLPYEDNRDLYNS